MNYAVILGSGFFFFLSAYVPYAFWEDLLWRKKILAGRDALRREYEDLFKLKTEKEVLNEMLIWGSVVGVLAFLASPNHGLGVVLAIIAFFWGIKFPMLYAKSVVRKRRIKTFTMQMIDALTLMANGMRSGLNIPQTLQIVVDEMPAPVSQEFGLVLDQNRIGVPLEVGFENLAKRINTEEIFIFSTSVNILRETGGNMAETFDTIVKTIRERVKLQNKISAMTAQGRTAGLIVGCIPFATAGMMYFIDPEFILPLFTTIPGLLICLCVCTLVGVGLFVINKLVNIKV